MLGQALTSLAPPTINVDAENLEAVHGEWKLDVKLSSADGVAKAWPRDVFQWLSTGGEGGTRRELGAVEWAALRMERLLDRFQHSDTSGR